MFEQSLLEPTRSLRPKTKYAMLASLAIQCVMIGVAILIPLLYTNPLPAFQLAYVLSPPGPPPPAAPPQPKVRREAPEPFRVDKLRSPSVIPKTIPTFTDEQAPASTLISQAAGEVPWGVPGGIPSAVPGNWTGIAPAAPPPAPKVEPSKPAPPSRPIRVGGDVLEANKIYAPLPVYPPLAKQARISGAVRLNAVINKEGAIEQLSVVSGHPLLVPAALDAVRTWRYRPTLLNGQPVEVITQIDVHFTLSW